MVENALAALVPVIAALVGIGAVLSAFMLGDYDDE